MTPCLGPEPPQSMRICLAMMKNMAGVRVLSGPAFSILEIDGPQRCNTISGSGLLLEVTHNTDDLHNWRTRERWIRYLNIILTSSHLRDRPGGRSGDDCSDNLLNTSFWIQHAFLPPPQALDAGIINSLIIYYYLHRNDWISNLYGKK